MPLSFLFDEHLRGTLPEAVLRQARRQGYFLDVVQVGDMPDLPLGTPDPVILRWAAAEGRILVSRDVKSLPDHLAAHQALGHRSAGIFIVREPLNLALADWLVLYAVATDPDEWADRIAFIP